MKCLTISISFRYESCYRFQIKCTLLEVIVVKKIGAEVVVKVSVDRSVVGCKLVQKLRN